MRLFVTGSAGFIGYHLVSRLLQSGHEVMGYDGMTPYYDVELKRARNAMLQRYPAYTAVQAMLEDKPTLIGTVSEYRPEVIIHLAAQAGVRYSLEAPDTYINSNIVGTYNLLEAARIAPPRHLLFSSTSSVYGGNHRKPFRETDRTDFPLSIYAATKLAGEELSHSYAHLFQIPTTCFRFFTVYGPWGRPDMALFKFANLILSDRPIEIFGNGQMDRDFTFIDDLITGIDLLIGCVPALGEPVMADGVYDSLSPVAPWRVVNIAGGKPVPLMDFVTAIEAALGKSAQKIFLPMQLGDLKSTAADPGLLRALVGHEPSTELETGVKEFVNWYRTYREGQQ